MKRFVLELRILLAERALRLAQSLMPSSSLESVPLNKALADYFTEVTNLLRWEKTR